ncbi:MAG: hypothetical protein EHM48_01455 [Planctomycetaceae bacterium]|nr:MAG: hypothetical protein EHM48_01455 [Planctomycetaceae bacterium]
MTMRRTIATILLAATAVLTVGCSDDPNKGYSTQSLYPEKVKSVAVPMWNRGGKVYRRGWEYTLTEAIQKQIQLDTKYKILPTSRADTILEGTIDEISQRVLSNDPDSGNPREKEIRFEVSFTWKDLRTGEILAQRTRMPVTATYIPLQPFSEDFFQGGQDAANRIAQAVVEQMESDWGK